MLRGFYQNGFNYIVANRRGMGNSGFASQKGFGKKYKCSSRLFFYVLTYISFDVKTTVANLVDAASM